MSYTNKGFDSEEKRDGGSRQAEGQDSLPRICIIGSGDFGRALASRLGKSGYRVTIASRDISRNRDLIPPGVGVCHISEVASADVVLVAIPFNFYSSLPIHLLADKIVVDVSNRNKVRRDESEESQAEMLARLLPFSRVVKSFNVLSAYSLGKFKLNVTERDNEKNGGLQGSKQVYVAGDDAEARDVVSSIVRNAGFTPVDTGSLVSAREIEDIPVSVFRQWRTPFYIHLAIFTFLYVLSFVKMQICWPLTWSTSFLWHLWNHIPMDNMNKTLAVHALVTLALCYLPGVLAAWLQIVRGTKYSRFPSWLDNWLKMRKQLGLLMFFAASIHACLSVAYMSPTYQKLAYGEPVVASVHVMEGEGWGPKTESVNRTSVEVYGGEKMTWQGECFLMTGVLGFGLVGLLAISSLPSVTASLTWKEFAFIQSGLGWLAMILLCSHDMFYGWKYINTPSCGIPSSFQYALYIPLLTILLKIPLVLPPLSCHLDKIRSGYVRTNLLCGSKKTATETV